MIKMTPLQTLMMLIYVPAVRVHPAQCFCQVDLRSAQRSLAEFAVEIHFVP